MNGLTQKRRNQKHRETLRNLPEHVKKERIEKHKLSYRSNRETHSNYKPISLLINDKDLVIFDSESEFLSETKFENSVLRKLKTVGNHTVKTRTKRTRHNYPIGTTFELVPSY